MWRLRRLDLLSMRMEAHEGRHLAPGIAVLQAVRRDSGHHAADQSRAAQVVSVHGPRMAGMRTGDDVFREKLAQLPPPPGWSNPGPSGESHWILKWTKPACGLALHYIGERFGEPPAEPCEKCAARAAETTAADG